MGKTIRVTPKDLITTGGELVAWAQTYKEIYTQLLQDAGTMGGAWQGEDNVAFVNQINGFCEKLEAMSKKLELAGTTLKQQGKNYANRQDENTAMAKKLPN